MKVSAIIVTRGDVDLQPVLESLPVGWEKVVWDNSPLMTFAPEYHWRGLATCAGPRSTGGADLGVYGRYAAVKHTTAELIYVQDDDVIVSDPQAIVDALECDACSGTGAWTGWSGDDEYTQEGGCESCEGTGYNQDILVANQPQEFRHDGYTDSCLVGFGACFHRDAPRRAFDRWQAAYRPDASQGVRQWTDEPSFNRTADVIFTTLTPRVLVDVPKTNLPWAEDEGRMYRQPRHVEERTRMLELVRKVRDS